MARTERKPDRSEQEILARYVDEDTGRYPGGRADARLRNTGVSVWAVVAALRVYDGDRAKVADHFVLSQDEVEVALLYYERNKALIDARLALDEA